MTESGFALYVSLNTVTPAIDRNSILFDTARNWFQFGLDSARGTLNAIPTAGSKGVCGSVCARHRKPDRE